MCPGRTAVRGERDQFRILVEYKGRRIRGQLAAGRVKDSVIGAITGKCPGAVVGTAAAIIVGDDTVLRTLVAPE